MNSNRQNRLDKMFVLAETHIGNNNFYEAAELIKTISTRVLTKKAVKNLVQKLKDIAKKTAVIFFADNEAKNSKFNFKKVANWRRNGEYLHQSVRNGR